MFGEQCIISRGSEQGKEQADTGHYKRKVGLILIIEEYFKTHNIGTCVLYSYTGIKGGLSARHGEYGKTFCYGDGKTWKFHSNFIDTKML